MLLAQILDDESQIRSFLEETFGLTKESLLSVVRQSAFQYDTATEYHPVTFAGSSAWFEMVRALRELLIPLGWKKLYEHGLDKTINNELGVSIVCTSGNSAVCKPLSEGVLLLSKNDKGGTMERTVEQNRLQGDLFESDDFYSSALDSNSTWVLIYHIDKNKKEMRAELSLPISMTAGHKIGGWSTRVFLGTISLDNIKLVTPSTQADFSDIIDIPVRSKKNE